MKPCPLRGSCELECLIVVVPCPWIREFERLLSGTGTAQKIVNIPASDLDVTLLSKYFYKRG